jgi:hypothetical protein
LEVAKVSQSLISKAMLDCEICRHKATAKKAPVGKPISAKGIWQCVGIDLIDMSSRPDGQFKWIYCRGPLDNRKLFVATTRDFNLLVVVCLLSLDFSRFFPKRNEIVTIDSQSHKQSLGYCNPLVRSPAQSYRIVFA